MMNDIDGFDALKRRIREIAGLGDHELDQIVGRFAYRKIAKDEFLLRQGDRCTFWGFVHTGLLRAFVDTSAGEEFTNWFAWESNFITEYMSFFTQSASLENFVALEDTELIFVDYDTLQRLFEEFPGFEKFGRLLYEQTIVQTKGRMLHRIHLDAQSRYGQLLATQPTLLQRVPLKYLASYLGITDSTLSRIRRKLTHTAA